MLDPHRVDIEGWLETQPVMTAVEVLARPRQHHRAGSPTITYYLRTFQRMVTSSRALEAKEIIHSTTAALALTAGDRWAQPMSGSGNIHG